MRRLRFRCIASVLAILGAAAPSAHAQGVLVAWGDNSTGIVSGAPAGNFVDVAAGYGHAVALRADGTLVSWGADSYGVVSGTPAGTFVRVAAGGWNSIAIRSDGTLAAWGADNSGQVSGPNADGGTFLAAAIAETHTVALRTDGTLASWGEDLYGPVSDTPAGQYVAVAAGSPRVSMAIGIDGTLVRWGEFGNSTGLESFGGGFAAVAASNNVVAVGILTDGSLVTISEFNYPNVPAGAHTAVAVGYTDYYFSPHFVAIRTDGALVSWGDNSFGQVTATPAGSFVKVAAGWNFSVAISASASQTPAERIEALQVQAHELMQAGALSQGNGRALLAKLDAAHRALARGDTQAAIGALNAFVNQVAAFVSTGALTPAQGQSLDDAARAILFDLSG